MLKATRVLAAALGFFAGIGGPEHGYFEIKQGNVRPEGLMIASMGPPCAPKAIWNACEPAMTVIPSFLITGIVATLLGILTMIWSARLLLQRRAAAKRLLDSGHRPGLDGPRYRLRHCLRRPKRPNIVEPSVRGRITLA